MTVLAVLIVAALLVPHAVGYARGFRIGRSAIASHRQSVRLGVRLGRWQTVGVFVMGCLLVRGAL